jgi:hypothetical protein
LKAYLAHEKRSIELFEHYPKQTLRNRCDIATSNGKLRLSIPIKKPFGSKSLMKDILIDQDAQWQKEHWRSIRTAYAGAPYFEEYAHDIEALINTKHRHLISLNTSILEFIYKVLDITYIQEETSEYHTSAIHDFRAYDFGKQTTIPSYIQVFNESHGFIEDLSILDLLFNEGPFIRNWILAEES